jgi:hypothetical protein
MLTHVARLQYLLLEPPLQRPAQLVEISNSTWHSLAILTTYILCLFTLTFVYT